MRLNRKQVLALLVLMTLIIIFLIIRLAVL